MADHSRAVHKLEAAVDMVNDVNRMEKEALEVNDGASGKNSIKITPIQVRDMMNSFGIFDRNNDCSLDIDELARVFRVCGQNPTRKQLQDIADEADTDGNGVLDQNEYIELLARHMQTPDEIKQEMTAAFAVFDRKGNGKVSKNDLMTVLHKVCDEPLTPDEAEELMTLMDQNNDGYIDVDEFSSFLCNGTAMKQVKSKKKKNKAGQIKK